MLLEKVTVSSRHSEGEQPRWMMTNPTEQIAVGVWTWRKINGAWMEGLFLRASDYSLFDMYRVRLVVDGWAGFPRYVELYDMIGEVGPTDDLSDRVAMTERLFSTIRRVTNEATG